MQKIITQNGVETIEVKGNAETFSIIHRLRYTIGRNDNGYKCSVFNPREAKELRDALDEWIKNEAYMTPVEARL